MITGRYWGGVRHRKIITEQKRETLCFVKELTEEYLINPNETRKKIIEDQQAFYTRLCNYQFTHHP